MCHHQQTIHTSPRGGACECAAAFSQDMALVVTLDRVGITHQDDRGSIVFYAEGPDHVQHLGQTDPRRQRFVAGFLYDGAIGTGVRKRHSQFDHIGTGRDHAMHEIRRNVRKREAGGNVRNQGFAIACFECSKDSGYAAHEGTSCAGNATVE